MVKGALKPVRKLVLQKETLKHLRVRSSLRTGYYSFTECPAPPDPARGRKDPTWSDRGVPTDRAPPYTWECEGAGVTAACAGILGWALYPANAYAAWATQALECGGSGGDSDAVCSANGC